MTFGKRVWQEDFKSKKNQTPAALSSTQKGVRFELDLERNLETCIQLVNKNSKSAVSKKRKPQAVSNIRYNKYSEKRWIQ